jgi:hypothetical protein
MPRGTVTISPNDQQIQNLQNSIRGVARIARHHPLIDDSNVTRALDALEQWTFENKDMTELRNRVREFRTLITNYFDGTATVEDLSDALTAMDGEMHELGARDTVDEQLLLQDVSVREVISQFLGTLQQRYVPHPNDIAQEVVDCIFQVHQLTSTKNTP